MPLPGGAAGKAGNRFELKWVVRQFLRLLSGEAEWICLEPPVPEGSGIEFQIGIGGRATEVHQVKRQRGAAGVWTIPSLQQTGVLGAIRKHAIEANKSFYFVSMEAVKGLRELTDRAREANNFHDFENHFLNQELSGSFEVLLSGLAVERRDDLFAVLQRIFPTSIDERELTDLTASSLGRFIDGNPDTALSVLSSWALENTHRRVIAHDVWGALPQGVFGQVKLQPMQRSYRNSRIGLGVT